MPWRSTNIEEASARRNNHNIISEVVQPGSKHYNKGREIKLNYAGPRKKIDQIKIKRKHRF